jgi:hypothetical protein
MLGVTMNKKELLIKIKDLDLELNEMKKGLKKCGALGFGGLNLAIDRVQRDKDFMERKLKYAN